MSYSSGESGRRMQHFEVEDSRRNGGKEEEQDDQPPGPCCCLACGPITSGAAAFLSICLFAVCIFGTYGVEYGGVFNSTTVAEAAGKWIGFVLDANDDQDQLNGVLLAYWSVNSSSTF